MRPVTITGAGLPGPIIDVVGAGTVNLMDLTVDGLANMTPVSPGGTVIGIQYGLVNGTITNVCVQNIRNPPMATPRLSSIRH